MANQTVNAMNGKQKRLRRKRYVYSFGGGQADGDASLNWLLGGKGANLAEMAGLPCSP